MRRWGWLGLCLLLLPVQGEAGVPRNVPPLDDTLLRNFLKSLSDHLNTLECLTANPDGTANPPGVLGTHGELKCANYDGADFICMNTGTGPSKTTAWTCLNIAGGSLNITVENSDMVVDSAVTNIDFSSNFTVTSSPSGEANVEVTGFVTGTGKATNVFCAPAIWNTTTSIQSVSTPAGLVETNKGPLVSGCGSSAGGGSWHFGNAPLPNNSTGIVESVGGVKVNAGTFEDNLQGSSLSDIQVAIKGANMYNSSGNFAALGTLQAQSVGVFGSSYTRSPFGNTTAAKGQMYGVIGWGNQLTAATNMQKAVGGMFVGQATAGTLDYAAGIEVSASGATTNCPIMILSNAPGNFTGSTGLCLVSNATSTRTITFPDATGTAVLTSGTVSDITAGQWTPTTNNIANLDSSSATEGQYIQVGATVTGSIQLTVDPTTANTSTQLELDLPVASNFGATSDAAGSCGSPDIEDEVGAIRADITSDELEVLWITNSAASHELNCNFSYQVI